MNQFWQSLVSILAITRAIGDLAGVGRALGNLGATLIDLEQYSEALEYLQSALEISIKTGSRESEIITLYHLAILHQKFDAPALALKYCEQALAIATELGIPLAKACQELKEKFLSQIGDLYREFAEEDHKFAEDGLDEYAKLLRKEDLK